MFVESCFHSHFFVSSKGFPPGSQVQGALVICAGWEIPKIVLVIKLGMSLQSSITGARSNPYSQFPFLVCGGSSLFYKSLGYSGIILGLWIVQLLQ